MNIAIAKSEADLIRCYPVMAQLRPQFSETEFIRQVRRQWQGGYRLVYLEAQGDIQSLAGFRIHEMLAFGRHLYVDDLITSETGRSHGYGGKLFDWLVEYARSNACVRIELDSGVQRFGAHRFYLSKRMEISSHHFSLKL